MLRIVVKVNWKTFTKTVFSCLLLVFFPIFRVLSTAHRNLRLYFKNVISQDRTLRHFWISSSYVKFPEKSNNNIFRHKISVLDTVKKAFKTFICVQVTIFFKYGFWENLRIVAKGQNTNLQYLCSPILWNIVTLEVQSYINHVVLNSINVFSTEKIYLSVVEVINYLYLF